MAMEELEGGGTIKVDDAYITESIRKPLEKIVKGYKSVSMTVFPPDVVSDTRIQDIIEYIKELSK